MADSQTFQSLESYAEDLLNERSDRLLIIVGGSKADSLLCEILSIYLMPKLSKPREQDELLEGDRPLSTFSARIKICRRLGLIDEPLYHALELLRDLRNICAHSVAVSDKKSPMKDITLNLSKNMTCRKSFRLIKKRFFDEDSFKQVDELPCMLLTICFLLIAIKETTVRTEGNKIALGISTK